MNSHSFISSIRSAQQVVSSKKSQAEFKADQFDISNSSRHTPHIQTEFDGKIIEEGDPLFPGIRLVNRYISREELAKAIPSHTECLTLTEMFKQVSPPEFKRPIDSEANFMVIGIVATRSQFKTSAQGKKYVTMTLSDLKYDIVMALHGRAQEMHWKVQPGTLIAVFNPQFWVSKIENNRTLNLSVNKANCIIEIGQASDLGQCEATTAASNNTKRCRNWVDVRKTHFCDFHTEQRATRTKRPELSSQNGKLWDPKSIGKYHGSKMTVVQGGDVKWKRGLQIDSQAPKFKTSVGSMNAFGGFPDAPIGRVFFNDNANILRHDTGKFEKSVADRLKHKQRDKRSLERATADAELNLQLSSNKISTAPLNRVTKPADKSQVDLRKLGFAPKRLSRSAMTHNNLETTTTPSKKVATKSKASVPPAPSADSDSDLEII